MISARVRRVSSTTATNVAGVSSIIMEEKDDAAWDVDRAVAAISTAATDAAITASLVEILDAVASGMFTDPTGALKPVIVAAKAKKEGGVWSTDTAKALGPLLKAMRDPPPPAEITAGGAGGPEVVVNWEDYYEVGLERTAQLVYVNCACLFTRRFLPSLF